MSDDTPTQRLPENGGTPTEQFATAAVHEDLHDEKQKSRGLLVGLIIAGVLLIVAVIVLVVFLTAGTEQPVGTPTDTSTPIAQPTETATPTPEPTQSEAPEPTGAAFSSFETVDEVSCSLGGPGFTPDPPAIEVAWTTVRTVSVWIVQGTSDAADSGFMQLTNNGDQSDFAYPLQFPCFQDSTQYTMTLVGDDGVHVSQTWTITNIGDRN